ncbi:hypothetical protein B0H11DRAFT_326911 [Mycena galericulata]|nr:hypothetical protein B0H11DRAFT_326911 [Mycena galericulata]
MLEKDPVDSDAPRLRRRRRPSRCALILTAFAALTLIYLGVRVFTVFRYLKSTGLYDFPPRDLFVKETDIRQVANRSDVVQPLIGLDDTFDIAVTVWQRATDDEQLEQFRKVKSGSAQPHWDDMWSIIEKPRFSDIVFRGLRLSDTDIHTNITFQIPTRIFQDTPANRATKQDLRATFVLIPRSPSLLDYYKSFTTWFPAVIYRKRFKSFPFPLTSPTEYQRKVTDRALESFAISIPLLERHAVPSICPPRTNDSVENTGNLDSPDKLENEVLLNHPHVITRTHLRVVRESRLFRRDAYLAKHERLREDSCGQRGADGNASEPNLNLCAKGYEWNGNWETMLQLAIPDPDAAGGFREESAYAPYMDILWNPPSPKDILPIPISREHCDMSGADTAAAGTRALSDHMNITWFLSYSSVTPRIFVLGDMIRFNPLPSHYSDSELTQAYHHEAAEIRGSLTGIRYGEHTHPRRRVVRLVLALMTTWSLHSLNFIYWATRKSTTFISVPGTLCTVASALLALSAIYQTGYLGAKLSDRQRMTGGIVSLIIEFVDRDGPLAFLMLRAVSPIEFFRDGTMVVPRLRWARPTHQERTSRRLDARTDWRWKCGIFAGLLLVNYTLTVRQAQFLIITPVIPTHHEGERPNILSTNMSIVVDALSMSGAVLQLILNYRAQVFAGRYKASVVLSVVLRFLHYASTLPAIVGRSEIMNGVTYTDAVWDVLMWTSCWQAWKYSSRIPADEDQEDGN